MPEVPEVPEVPEEPELAPDDAPELVPAPLDDSPSCPNWCPRHSRTDPRSCRRCRKCQVPEVPEVSEVPEEPELAPDDAPELVPAPLDDSPELPELVPAPLED